MTTRSALVLAAFACLCGCNGREGPVPGGTIRDSAGIRVLELPAPDPGAPRRLALDPGWTPAGRLELGPEVALDVARGGRVVLLDGSAARVIVLSSSGTAEASFGRRGEGPGELDPRILRWVVATDSSVVVPDLYQQRVSEFTLDGRFLAVRSLPVAAGSAVYAVDWRRHPQGGLVYRVLDEEGDLLVRWRDDRLDTLFVFEPAGVAPNTLLEPVPVWDVTADGALLLGRSDRGTVTLARDDGPWIARLPDAVGHALTGAEREHLEEVLVASVEREGGGGGLSRADLLAQVHLPERAPVIAGIRAAPDGSVWARLARDVLSMDRELLRVGTAEGFGGADWLVLRGDGTLRERVRLPEGFEVRVFRDRWIYGIVTDEMGVPAPARVAWR